MCSKGQGANGLGLFSCHPLVVLRPFFNLEFRVRTCLSEVWVMKEKVKKKKKKNPES